MTTSGTDDMNVAYPPVLDAQGNKLAINDIVALVLPVVGQKDDQTPITLQPPVPAEIRHINQTEDNAGTLQLSFFNVGGPYAYADNVSPGSVVFIHRPVV